MKEIARTELGRIAVEPKVLERLVREAAQEGGALVTAVTLSLGDDVATSAALSVKASRRSVLPEVGASIKEQVADALAGLLGVAPARVDVTIEGILVEGEG